MSEMGLVTKDWMIGQIRTKVRQDCYRQKLWKTVGEGLLGLDLSERGDVVMIDHDDYGVIGLSVVKYAEELGDSLRIRIEPRFCVTFSERSSQGRSIDHATGVELIARINEARDAAGKTGVGSIAVDMPDGGVRTDKIAEHVRHGLRLMMANGGAGIELNGVALEPMTLRKEGESRTNPATLVNPAVAVLCRWEPYAADDPEIARRVVELGAGVALPEAHGWMPDRKDAEGRTPVTNGDLEAYLDLEGGDNPDKVGGFLAKPTQELLEAFYRQEQVSPFQAVANMMASGSGDSAVFRTSALATWSAGGRQHGLCMLLANVGADVRDGVFHLGYMAMITPMAARKDAPKDVLRLLAFGLAHQFEDDIEALAGALPQGVDSRIDIAALVAPTDDADANEILLDALDYACETALDMAYERRGEDVTGEIMIGSMPKR